ncbi:MAG: 2-oxoacid:ferredoxin oxidoreductase subunit beta [bacterium]
MMQDIIHQYLRTSKKFPHVWCPGCGDGIVLSAIVRAIHSLGKSKNETVLVSGIGCSSRAPVYVDFPALHGTHGRALAFATGIKMANPELTVVVITGDGDGLAIGGNHFIHACRRNIDITAVVFNNSIYGMTGGQYSPTMKVNDYGATAPYGNIERPFDVCDLASAAGANFVARATAYHAIMLEKFIKMGIAKKGLSIIDVITPCPTLYSFYNKAGKNIDMMESIRDRTITIQKAEQLSDTEKEDKIVVGIFANRDFPEYTGIYSDLMERAKRSVKDEELL